MAKKIWALSPYPFQIGGRQMKNVKKLEQVLDLLEDVDSNLKGCAWPEADKKTMEVAQELGDYVFPRLSEAMYIVQRLMDTEKSKDFRKYEEARKYVAKYDEQVGEYAKHFSERYMKNE